MDGSTRSGWARRGGVLLSAAVLLACANRTDERVKKAWGGGAQAPDDRQGAGPDGASSSEGGGPADAPIRVGWDRVDEILDAAVTEASVGTDEEVMARLARRLCAVEPEPNQANGESLRVCRPSPPVRIDGHTFTLELGGEGVIGLVATDLSNEESARLAEEARRRTDRWCTRPWNDVSPPADPSPPSQPTAQLFSCAVEGSALLVVGRLMPEASELWQVSVAVIDAS